MQTFKEYTEGATYYITHFTYKNKKANHWDIEISHGIYGKNAQLTEYELQKATELLSKAKKGKLIEVKDN
jgi:hypothetical protein